MPKNKPGQHLQFYINCVTEVVMPNAGLCSCRELDQNLLSLFEPSIYELARLRETGFNYVWWASGSKYSSRNRVFKFRPLRQTIVLLMAAMNNEL